MIEKLRTPSRGGTNLGGGPFAEDTLHRLISRESQRRHIPLQVLLRATLLAAAEDQFAIDCDPPLSLSRDWRNELQRLAALVELQNDWGWWHNEPWSNLKLVRTTVAEYLAWLDRMSAAAMNSHRVELRPACPWAGGSILKSGLPGRPSKGKHLIDDEFKRRAAVGELAADLAADAGALLDWYARTYPQAERPTVKTIKNNIRDRHRQWIASRTREAIEAEPRPKE